MIPQNPVKTVSVTQTISVEPSMIDSLFERLERVIREAVAAGLNTKPATRAPESKEAPPDAVDATKQTKAAAGLRQQAANGGLIDQRMLARLLDLHPRTLRRLALRGVVPMGKYFSQTLVRWRADEISDWIDAGCPLQAKWERMRDSRYDEWQKGSAR